MVSRFFTSCLLLVLFALPAQASENFVRLQSPHSVAVTADKLVAAIEGAGLGVFARIDHQAGAEKAGLTLAPSQVVLFGNPKMGTVLMNKAPEIGLDLPLKVLIYQNESGSTWLVYTHPDALKGRHGVEGADKVFETMTGALAKLTGAAVAP